MTAKRDKLQQQPKVAPAIKQQSPKPATQVKPQSNTSRPGSSGTQRGRTSK